MTGLRGKEEGNFSIIHIFPDGSIDYMDKGSRDLFQITDRRPKHFTQLTDDPFIRSELNKCFTGKASHFIASLQKNNHLFLFDRVLEDKQLIKITLTIFNVDRMKADQNQSNWNANLLASIGEMSAGIAHEVRNPLTSVKGFLQLLSREYNHQYIDIAQDELERAVNILNDLLAVSRPNPTNEPFVSMNIASEMESTLLLFQNQLYSIEVNKNFLNPTACIYGKKNQLKKAFFNLIKNAIEAMPKGGTLTLVQYREPQGVHITVEDTGMGIPKDKIPILGTPFFTMKKDGTGMGLAQVFSAVNDNNGRIQVDSQEGIGTKFRLFFPIAASEQTINDYWGGSFMKNVMIKEEQSLESFLMDNAGDFTNIWFKYLEDTKSYILDFHDEKEVVKKRFNDLIILIARNIDYIHYDAIKEWTKEVGTTRARLDFPINLSWEIFQTSREILWKAIETYYNQSGNMLNMSELFTLERKVNNALDIIINHFTSYYVKYKNELLQSQRETVDELSVPVIPLTNQICILPIVGNVDTYRAKMIRERTLQRVKELKAKKLIIDISGVPYVDTAVVNHLFKIVKGIKLLGCSTILTGISAEIADTMIELGVEVDNQMETKSDLQQALQDIGLLRE